MEEFLFFAPGATISKGGLSPLPILSYYGKTGRALLTKDAPTTLRYVYVFH